MDWTSKIFRVSTKCIIISFLITFYIVLIYKNYKYDVSDEKMVFIGGLIAWIPIIIYVMISIIYSFILFSDVAKKLKNEIFLSLIFQTLYVIWIVIPPEITRKIDNRINIIILLFSFTVSFLLHNQIGKGLIKVSFSMEQEFILANRVSKKMEQMNMYKWSKCFERLSLLYIVLYVIHPSPFIFCCMMLVISIILICLLFQYMKSFKIDLRMKNCNINFIIVILNYILSTFIGIVYYCVLEWKIFSFIVIYSAFFSKLMADKKIALFIRKNYIELGK